jgi:hypothetical protein
VWRLLAALWLAAMAGAADSRPVVGPGATRDEVIAAYGWPSGQSQAGAREILTYPQGRIALVEGKVELVDFSPAAAWPAPRPRPAAPTVTTARAVATVEKEMPPVDYWGTDFAEAVREATIRHARILALFTGSDWSPPSKRFHDDVAMQAGFINAVLGDFVLLRLDFPTHTAQPPGLREQNARLRERCNVTTYPSLLVLSAAGDQVGTIDLSKLNPALPAGEQVAAAVTTLRHLLEAPAKAAQAAQTAAAAAAPAEPEGRGNRPWLAVGVVVALGLGWWLLRRGGAKEASAPAPDAPVTQLPTAAETALWSQTRLRDVCAAMCTEAGYRVTARPPGSGADFALHRGDEGKPEILVHCRSGATGLAGPRPVRELFAAVFIEGVATGWVVAPAGFTTEAREVAAERGLLLIGREELMVRLGEMPPPVLMKTLSKGG